MSVINLDRLFRPRSIALLGADRAPRSVGGVLARNLFKGGFDGPVMPVHAHDAAVGGVLAYHSVDALPMAPDLAVIASPPPEIPALIAALGDRGTRAAVIVSHNFDRECATAGAALRQSILDAARPFGLRIVGPACLGVIVPEAHVNASYAHMVAAPGDLAFISQSGSLMTLMLDWAAPRSVGFSMVVSLGDMSDVDFGDMLDYLAFDGETRAVLLCINRIAHPRKFLSAARAAARLKPIIVFDAGAAARPDAAELKRGYAPGLAEVNDAAFRRAGMLPVPTLADLVAAAGTLGTNIRISGDRLAVLANGRGIADVAGGIVRDEGGTLAALGETTLIALDQVLPPTWGRRNPVNLFADATAERWRDALGPLLADPGVDAIVAINTPTAVGDTLDAARTVADRLVKERKPVAAVWLEESTLDETRQVFAQQRIPLYDDPGQAIEALMQVVRWRRNQAMLMQTPASLPEPFAADTETARQLIHSALSAGRHWLSEPDTMAVLAAFGLATLTVAEAGSTEDAIDQAKRIGYPVSLQVRLPEFASGINAWAAGATLRDPVGPLDDAAAVAAAAHRLKRRLEERCPSAPFAGFSVRAHLPDEGQHELRLALAVDPRFGPVILFGQGGAMAQVMPDRAVGLPPLNLSLARLLIGETRAAQLLQGYGEHPAVDLEDVALALVKFAQVAADLAEIAEIDVNPLLAGKNGVQVGGARMRIVASPVDAHARLAIRPYPSEFEKRFQARDGRTLLLRPIRPEDEPALRAFVQALTPEDRRLRFFSHVKELDHRMAARLTQIDYDREMALVVVDPQSAEPAILGVMRISADPDNARAEYAGAVRSELKGMGLGRLLMEEIIACAAARGIGEVWGEVLTENAPMLGLARKLGFELDQDRADPAITHVRKPLVDHPARKCSRPSSA